MSERKMAEEEEEKREVLEAAGVRRGGEPAPY